MSGKRGAGDKTSTALIIASELRERLARARKARQSQASLMVVHRGQIQVVPLAEGRRIRVGRADDTDLVIDTVNLSRRHAALRWSGDALEIEDLGSTNGTWIDGERVHKARAEPGSELAFGPVTASIQVMSRREKGDLVPCPHDRFRAELVAEVDRVRAGGRPFALLMMRRRCAPGQSAASWIPELRSRLRSFDRLALYSRDTLEVLLPEVGVDGAEAAALRLLRAVQGARCAVGVMPLNAGTAEELLDVTRAASHLATEREPLIRPPDISDRSGRSVEVTIDGPVVHSPAMTRVMKTAAKVGSKVIPVLLQGETGVGKEVVAQAIHEAGPRRDAPLVCINCGSIPDKLVESTLFGHEKGAFTGADRRAMGIFESAEGGTVLLDEIGELPAQAQASLLRVLETKRFRRVGGNREIEVDVRVLAATHRDLEQMVADGGFRQDLLYRLNALTLPIPPLRERPEDIEPLAHHFLAEANAANDCSVRGIGDEALALLMAYDWPGNVRELRNAMERAVVIADDIEVVPEVLPERVRAAFSVDDGADSFTTTIGLESTAEDLYAGGKDLRQVLEDVEGQLILAALRRAEGDSSRAAADLGVPRRTLQHKMKRMDIRRGDFERRG